MCARRRTADSDERGRGARPVDAEPPATTRPRPGAASNRYRATATRVPELTDAAGAAHVRDAGSDGASLVARRDSSYRSGRSSSRGAETCRSTTRTRAAKSPSSVPPLRRLPDGEEAIRAGSRGKVSAFPGMGVRPGVDVWVATPLGVVRYSDAEVDIDVAPWTGRASRSPSPWRQAELHRQPARRSARTGDCRATRRRARTTSSIAQRERLAVATARRRHLAGPRELVRACANRSDAAARRLGAKGARATPDELGDVASAHVEPGGARGPRARTARAQGPETRALSTARCSAQLAPPTQKWKRRLQLRHSLTPLPRAASVLLSGERMRMSAGKTLGLTGSRRQASWPAVLRRWRDPARADEPMKVGEPRVMSEPGEVTDVVDAFDGDDLFDLHLTLGYQVLVEDARTSAARPPSNADESRAVDGRLHRVEHERREYDENTSRLNTAPTSGSTTTSRSTSGCRSSSPTIASSPISTAARRSRTSCSRAGPTDPGGTLFSTPLQVAAAQRHRVPGASASTSAS